MLLLLLRRLGAYIPPVFFPEPKRTLIAGPDVRSTAVEVDARGLKVDSEIRTSSIPSDRPYDLVIAADSRTLVISDSRTIAISPTGFTQTVTA